MLDKALTSIFFHKTVFWLVIANLAVFVLMQLSQRSFLTAGIITVLTLSYYFTVGHVVDERCAFHYYSVFHHQSVAESYLVRPIEEAGHKIGPLLIEKVANKEMKYRRYAILGLQKIDYKPATNLMGKILFDTSEQVVYRADAYEALKAFNNERAYQLLEEFNSQANDSTDLKVIELGESNE